MPQQALAHLNVLDLSLDIGGAYCTKLLADLGATVLMVEPPHGHPLRRAGPFPDDEPHPEKSGLFLYYCANKHGVSLDLTQSADCGAVLDLAAQAHLVVESFPPGRMDELGLGLDALRERNPAVVLTSVSHFGQTGPYRDWQGEEIVDYALGGYMYFGGHRDREPLMVPNNQPQLNAGAQAALASLAAVWWAGKTGQGQHVDVSALEAMLSAHCWTSAAWTHEGTVLRRTESDATRCKDGWVVFMLSRWDPNVFVLAERPELMDDPRFSQHQAWLDHMEELHEVLGQWCAHRTKEEVFHRAQELRIAVAPVYDARDLLRWDHLRQREWFLEGEHPVAGPTVFPGFPYKLSETPARVRRPAPPLGGDATGWPDRSSRARDAGGPTPDWPPLEPPAAASPPLPLAGVRILELTGHWAGPLAGRYLADLGAEIIKVEPPNNAVTRGSHYAGTQPFRYHYNRSAYFNKMNRNKYGATLDLSRPQGRDLFLRLVNQVDVVLENYSPRVLPNLGLDYPVLRQANPGIIMVSLSSFGQTGPARDSIAFGANIEAACGLCAVTGYPDDEMPYRTSLYYADPVTSCHAAIAIQAALMHRLRTGQGQHIDISLLESGLCFFPEAVLEYTVMGRVTPRRGNRHPRYAPQGCYPSQGDDMWVVLCIRDDDEWRRFVQVVGDDSLRDQRFATEAGRRDDHDGLDARIARWTRRYDHHEAAVILQKAGIPAAPVLANWELLSNPHIHQRGFYVPVAHREMGVFPYPGMPWKLSATPGAVRRASPCFGEHNRLVFQDLLRLTDEDLAPLYAQRIIADEPPADLRGPVQLKPR
ncbi:MAG: CoA transferase [Dehalococcoidia bacterium]